jgi:hypothetical protein
MRTADRPANAIPATRVIGASVFDSDGERLGVVEDIMLDKTSNGILYAVISFGGFLGLGERYRALAWSLLEYDPALGGYVVPRTRRQLEAAPARSIEELSQALADGPAPPARNRIRS